MSFGQHRHFFPFFGQLFEFGDQFVDDRIIDIVNGIPERTGNRCIVDILWSQAEMDEFFVLVEVQCVEPFLNEVFHSFHVVVGYFLDVFDPLGIFDGEIEVYFP